MLESVWTGFLSTLSATRGVFAVFERFRRDRVVVEWDYTIVAGNGDWPTLDVSITVRNFHRTAIHPKTLEIVSFDRVPILYVGQRKNDMLTSSMDFSPGSPEQSIAVLGDAVEPSEVKCWEISVRPNFQASLVQFPGPVTIGLTMIVSSKSHLRIPTHHEHQLILNQSEVERLSQIASDMAGDNALRPYER